MTQQDARERAWQEYDAKYIHMFGDECPDIAKWFWDAAKREDEQRIAALVEVVRRFTLYLDDRGHDEYGALAKEFGPVEVSGSSISTEAWLDRVLRNPALRALAGQTEAMSAG